MMTKEGRDCRAKQRLITKNNANYLQHCQKRCPYCEGTGILLEHYSVDPDNFLIPEDLEDIPFEVCHVCRGTGTLRTVTQRKFGALVSTDNLSADALYPSVTFATKLKILAMVRAEKVKAAK
jgi:hypothetical protein